jgi:hypothetical protein
VYAPVNASNLPVLVWIHGGGYGVGNGQQDFTSFINANGNDIIVVSIQYRVSKKPRPRLLTWLNIHRLALSASSRLTRFSEMAL